MIKNFTLPTLTNLKTAVLMVPLLVLAMGSLSLVIRPAHAAASSPPSAVFEQAAVAGCKKTFFGLVPWYEYMTGEFFSSSAPTSSQSNPCAIKCFNLFNQTVANDCGQKNSDIPGVLLAVIDDLLRVGGLAAIAFVLVGAFQLVTSQGSAEETVKARSTILNALIGLAIAMTAIAFISFIGSKIGGP
jgi:hypothetical protein